jgi:hypothetical protein
MSYLRYLCLLTYSGVQHILRCEFVLLFPLVYPVLPVFLGYSFIFDSPFGILYTNNSLLINYTF